MTLLFMELKKIWKLKILLVLAILGVLWGFLFLEFPLKYFPNGPGCVQQYQLMQEWKSRYGTHMDEAEYEDAVQELKERLHVPKEEADVDAELLMSYADGGDGYLQTWAGALFAYEIRYRYESDEEYLESLTPAQQERFQEICDERELDGIFPYEIMGNAWEYWRWVLIFLIASVLLFLSPVITRDSMTGVRRLQHTSRYGKSVLRTQFFAVLLSAAGLILAELLIFGGLYLRLGTMEFRNHPIQSFFYGMTYWFDLTYGQYAVCLVLLMILFAAGAAGIAFFFSCTSKNYVSLLLKLVPVLVIIGILGNASVSYLFSFDNKIHKLTGIRGVEMICGVLIFVFGMLLGIAVLRYKMKKIR